MCISQVHASYAPQRRHHPEIVLLFLVEYLTCTLSLNTTKFSVACVWTSWKWDYTSHILQLFFFFKLNLLVLKFIQVCVHRSSFLFSFFFCYPLLCFTDSKTIHASPLFNTSEVGLCLATSGILPSMSAWQSQAVVTIAGLSSAHGHGSSSLSSLTGHCVLLILHKCNWSLKGLRKYYAVACPRDKKLSVHIAYIERHENRAARYLIKYV